MHIKLLHIIAVACGCLLDPSRAHDATEYGCEDLVVAGGGTGGLYSAWRMIEAGLVDPNKTCIFEQTQRLGGRMRSVRGDELPEELSAIGSQAIDVAAYRAWPALHPLVVAIWPELGIETGCYHDIAFRTGDCTPECSPTHAIHKYIRDKYITYDDTLDSVNVPYNLGASNQYNTSSTYLSPYDWLYGPYAPPFVLEHLDDLAFNEDPTVRWAARDAIVNASAHFTINGDSTTSVTLDHLARTGYNSGGVKMTQEDFDFYIDNDCSTAEHGLTRAGFHDILVEHTNYIAAGFFLGLGGSFEVPVDSDGKQIGYDVLTIKIAEQLTAMGVEIYFQHKVDRAYPSTRLGGDGAMVKFTDLAKNEEFEVATDKAVLNIPSEYIVEVLGDEAIEKYGRGDLYDVFRMIMPFGLFKAYPYYEDAWWAKLGYTSGRVKTTLEIYHSRYHDGYSSCSDDSFQNCSGVLLGTYGQGKKGGIWAQDYFPPRSPLESSDGLITVRRGEGPAAQDRFLDSLHAQNMESHKDVLAEVGIDVGDITAPDLCLVGEYLGPTAGMHIRHANDLPAGTIDEAINMPFPGYNIHLVNEAYGIPPGWLQASFYCAERMLHHVYGLDKAPWFNDDVFEGFDSAAWYDSVIGNSNGAMK
ncbi:unnamed protein product [Scytosiphon promiscuus]